MVIEFDPATYSGQLAAPDNPLLSKIMLTWAAHALEMREAQKANGKPSIIQATAVPAAVANRIQQG